MVLGDYYTGNIFNSQSPQGSVNNYHYHEKGIGRYMQSSEVRAMQRENWTVYYYDLNTKKPH